MFLGKPPSQDPIQPKPRRIRIQLDDDDDDEDDGSGDDDDDEEENDGERNLGASTAATALTDEGPLEKGVSLPAVDRPQYRVSERKYCVWLP